MPVLTPQDVAGIYDILQTLEKLEAQKKVPPGTTEAKMLELKSQYGYGMGREGTSANEGFTGFWTGEDPIEAPWGDDPNFRRRQSMANSMAEDAALREALGYQRRRTDADQVEGQFAAAWYPGIDMEIWRAESGMPPVGMMPMMNPTNKRAQGYAKGRKDWARQQRDYLGMDQPIGRDEWKGYLQASKGLGAKERRDFFRRFLGR